MNANNFIRNNPFPTNGAELNLKTVEAIQHTHDFNTKQELRLKLLKINARLIWIIYVKCNYGESLDSIMSFMYEGICRAADSYSFASGVPFYIYLLNKTRSIMQTHFAYTSKLIHIPVKSKYAQDIQYVELYDDIIDDVSEEDPFEHIFELASQQNSIESKLLYSLKFHSLNELSSIYNLPVVKIKRLLKKIKKNTYFNSIG